MYELNEGVQLSLSCDHIMAQIPAFLTVGFEMITNYIFVESS